MKSKLWAALAGLVVLALFGTAPARAEWRRAESPHFVVYGEGSEARLRERILLLEDFHRLLTAVTGIQPTEITNKLNVYIVGGIDDLRIIRPAQAGLAGFYISTPYGIAAFVDGQAEAGGNEVLFHEYSHHFMWQYAPSAYPAWFVEGFADYYMTARFRERDMEFGNYSTGRAVAIAQGTWLPMDRVLFGTIQGLNRRDIGQYYAQSWFTAHYFYSTPERREKLRRLLRAIRTGTDPRVALEREAGFTIPALTQELRSYARARLSYWRMNRPAAERPAVTVTVLPRSANDLILLEAALRIDVHNEERGELIGRVRTAAARHADDPYARRVLAHAEVLHGDRAAGDRLLEPLIAATPNDAELLYLRGMRYLREAEQGEEWESNARNAARWFARAHRADENHYQTLFRYAQSLRGREAFDTENTANILTLAHNLAPQVIEISMNTANMLIRRRDFDTAEAILRPLAANPHNEGLAQAAQELLERARQARAATPSDAVTPSPPPAAPAANRPANEG